jgi:hypothetical protein
METLIVPGNYAGDFGVHTLGLLRARYSSLSAFPFAQRQ